MNQSRLAPIAECGLLIAMMTAFGMMAVYLPIVGTIVEFFWTLPLLIIIVRHGISRGLVSWLIATILFSMFVGPVTAVRMSISAGSVSIALGYGIEKKFRPVMSIVLALVAGFFAQIISVAIIFFALDINVIDLQLKMIRESFEQTFEFYSAAGIEPESLTEMRGQIEPAIEIVGIIMPLVFALTSALNVFMTYYGMKWIFPRIGLQWKMIDLPPFIAWRFPSAFLYLLAFSLIGLYWGATREIDLLYNASLNANIFVMIIGLVQGMAIVSFFTARKKIPKVFRNIFFIVMFFQFIILEIVAFVGLFDMIFDYRKRFTMLK